MLMVIRDIEILKLENLGALFQIVLKIILYSKENRIMLFRKHILLSKQLLKILKVNLEIMEMSALN